VVTEKILDLAARNSSTKSNVHCFLDEYTTE
jgi:hypothetical protein